MDRFKRNWVYYVQLVSELRIISDREIFKENSRKSL